MLGKKMLQKPLHCTRFLQQHHLSQQVAGLSHIHIAQGLLYLGQTGGVHGQHVIAHSQKQYGSLRLPRQLATDSERDIFCLAGCRYRRQRL